jgi:hypothetical protein
LGAAFLLENLRVIYAEDALNLWPCAFIVLGLLRLWNRGFFSVWGQLLVAGGVLFFVGVRNEAAVDVWWPILVVWAGLFLAMKAFLPRRGRAREHPREWRDGRRYDDRDVTVTMSGEGEERAQ